MSTWQAQNSKQQSWGSGKNKTPSCGGVDGGSGGGGGGGGGRTPAPKSCCTGKKAECKSKLKEEEECVDFPDNSLMYLYREIPIKRRSVVQNRCRPSCGADRQSNAFEGQSLGKENDELHDDFPVNECTPRPKASQCPPKPTNQCPPKPTNQCPPKPTNQCPPKPKANQYPPVTKDCSCTNTSLPSCLKISDDVSSCKSGKKVTLLRNGSDVYSGPGDSMC